MGLMENVRLAISSLKANKLRALLTMLGIIIGIASVITIVTIGDSLAASINSEMSGFGARNINMYLEQKNLITYNENGEEIYSEYGRYLNQIDSFEFPGLSGMDQMAGIMQGLREKPLEEIAGYKVVNVTDYKKPEETGLPAANVLIYKLENNETVIVRPSGTEPKIKIYYTTLGKNLEEAQAEKDKLSEALKPIMK